MHTRTSPHYRWRMVSFSKPISFQDYRNITAAFRSELYRAWDSPIDIKTTCYEDMPHVSEDITAFSAQELAGNVKLAFEQDAPEDISARHFAEAAFVLVRAQPKPGGNAPRSNFATISFRKGGGLEKVAGFYVRPEPAARMVRKAIEDAFTGFLRWRWSFETGNDDY